MKRGIDRSNQDLVGTRNPARIIRAHGRPRPVNPMTSARFPLIELPYAEDLIEQQPEPEPEPEQPKPIAARAMKAGKR
jgi:hypothetical protein